MAIGNIVMFAINKKDPTSQRSDQELEKGLLCLQ
jgi:hypothetical protein